MSDAIKEGFLTAFSNTLAKKRSERLAEEVKVQQLMDECRKKHEAPGKGYSDRLISLRHEIHLLEECVETLRRES